jgi:glutamine amidotransferase
MNNERNIQIIDTGICNVKSIVNMLQKINLESEVCRVPKNLMKNDFLILPGVGAFDQGMIQLRKSGWHHHLAEAVDNQIPILGLCLGMQLLFESSEEGVIPGLGIIPGSITKFSNKNLDGSTMKVPHMGWNLVKFKPEAPKWTQTIESTARFYFVHSFYFSNIDSKNSIGTTVHGEPFVSVVQQKNVIGLQFHPEKSHRYGMKMLNDIITDTNVTT